MKREKDPETTTLRLLLTAVVLALIDLALFLMQMKGVSLA